MNRSRRARPVLVLVTVGLVAAMLGVARSEPGRSAPVLVLATTIPQRDGHDARIEVYAAPDSRRRARPAFLTVGGPVYCRQILSLATYLGASLLCADYWRNGDTGPGLRAKCFMDWGDPAYDAAVAKLPERARRAGIRISKLVAIELLLRPGTPKR